MVQILVDYSLIQILNLNLDCPKFKIHKNKIKNLIWKIKKYEFKLKDSKKLTFSETAQIKTISDQTN